VSSHNPAKKQKRLHDTRVAWGDCRRCGVKLAADSKTKACERCRAVTRSNARKNGGHTPKPTTPATLEEYEGTLPFRDERVYDKGVEALMARKRMVRA
jgi:hypothetical protein